MPSSATDDTDGGAPLTPAAAQARRPEPTTTSPPVSGVTTAPSAPANEAEEIDDFPVEGAEE